MDLKEYLEIGGMETQPYSGRGMYGKECVSFTTDNVIESIVDILSEAAMNAEQGEEVDTVLEVGEMLKKARVDSMGLQMIVYFPGQKP